MDALKSGRTYSENWQPNKETPGSMRETIGQEAAHVCLDSTMVLAAQAQLHYFWLSWVLGSLCCHDSESHGKVVKTQVSEILDQNVQIWARCGKFILILLHVIDLLSDLSVG